MTERSIVVGLDGGGTNTRALCCTLSGEILAQAQAGGSSPSHNKPEDAERNVKQVMSTVLAQAERDAGDVRALVAGLAGLDDPKDQEWAERFTALDGLQCPRLHVNDAVIAHAGALQSRPGIIVICGTGSILFAVNENGEVLRNYDFHHYANTSARALAFDVLHSLLLGEAQADDSAFVQEVFAFWQADDMTALRKRILEFRTADWTQAVHAFGRMAGLVTDFASQCAPLPCRVCASSAGLLYRGVCLLGTTFATRPISVALIGSVARSNAMQEAIAENLTRTVPGQYQIVEPAFTPAVGAVLMALKECGVPLDAALLQRLHSYSQNQ